MKGQTREHWSVAKGEFALPGARKKNWGVGGVW